MNNFNYPKAHLGKRFIAVLVDLLVSTVTAYPGTVFIVGLFLSLKYIFLVIKKEVKLNDTFFKNVFYSEYFIGSIPLVYFFVKDGFMNGQSFGKKQVGLMVVDLITNKPCSKGSSFLRVFVMALLFIPVFASLYAMIYHEDGLMFILFIPSLVGFLTEPLYAMIQNGGRRLGDIAAKTQVIDVFEYEKRNIS